MKKLLALGIMILAGHVFVAFADEGQIIIDPETKKIIVMTDSGAVTADDEAESTGADTSADSGANLSVTSTGTTTGTVTTSGENTETNTPAEEPTTEFGKALAWMYANGLTKYNTEELFRANDGLTREEAAKVIGNKDRECVGKKGRGQNIVQPGTGHKVSTIHIEDILGIDYFDALKMDIEGGEFPIMERFAAHPQEFNFKKGYIEFHRVTQDRYYAQTQAAIDFIQAQGYALQIEDYRGNPIQRADIQAQHKSPYVVVYFEKT